jgi:hypothetical protein
MRIASASTDTRIIMYNRIRELATEVLDTKGNGKKCMEDSWFSHRASISATGRVWVKSACFKPVAEDASSDNCAPYALLSDDVRGDEAVLIAGATEATYVVIKTISYRNASFPHPWAVAHNDSGAEWGAGDLNPFREVILGYFMNALVMSKTTPHFPLLVTPFYCDASDSSAPTAGILMERAHMTFSAFLTHLVAQDDKKDMLRVALLQISHALLCAQDHFDFRHNDLHLENCMVTFIDADVQYTYDVYGARFTIPTHGMCWKVIDFGKGTSGMFGEWDHAHKLLNSSMFSAFTDWAVVTKAPYALEVLDMARLLHLGYEALADDNEGQLRATFADAIKILWDISLESATVNTLASAFAARTVWGDGSKVQEPSEEFVRSTRTTGLLREFFFRLAGFRYPPVGDMIHFYADETVLAEDDTFTIVDYGVPMTFPKPNEIIIPTH